MITSIVTSSVTISVTISVNCIKHTIIVTNASSQVLLL